MNQPRRVAIMGCGSGGSYLYYLLRRRQPQLEIALFDRPITNSCGVKGCAWGLSRPLFFQLCRDAGLLPEKYPIGYYDRIFVNGRRLKADLIIIDKPALLRDLLADADILNPSSMRAEEFDRIIDATGAERAFLSLIDAKPVLAAVQVRLKAKPPEAPSAVFNPGGGYSWIFPIGDDEIHLGSLSPWGYDAAKEELQKMMERVGPDRAVCSCRGMIRGHGPVTPFVEGKVWGLGEAVGLVDPVTCTGIIPAMVSAGLLVEHWDSPAAYECALLRRYSYMTKEAHVLNNLTAGHPLSSADLFFPKQALETIGIKPGPFELAGLVMDAARDYLGHRADKKTQPGLG